MPGEASAGSGTGAAPPQAAHRGRAETAPRPTPEEIQRDRGRWLRRHGLTLEIGLSVLLGLICVTVAGGPVVAVSAVLAVWAIGAFHTGRAVTSPLARQLRKTLNSAMLALAVAGLMVAFLGASVDVIRFAAPSVLLATAFSGACRMVRWRLQSPMRVLAVGDRIGVAQAIERFAGTPQSRVVGAAIVEADIAPEDVDSELFRIPVALGLPQAAAMVGEVEADLVVVNPGPGFTSVDLKRLQHMLERSPVTLGLMGALDAVAPHRIQPGWVANSSILDVRSPRPSLWVRSVKSTVDRLAAAVGLLLTAPLLLALMLWIRLDSPGPALFRQERVGRHGKLFTLYKLRTMGEDAEAEKAQLADEGVSDGVLFKLRKDPRVTRCGQVLRRYSLDELPQLLNVLRGDMALVGPRPHLPEEIAGMGVDDLRRLCVTPGITGLWQVSGRSNLSGEESAWLDVYYADNWSLAGDLKILAKTLPAVVTARGAY